MIYIANPYAHKDISVMTETNEEYINRVCKNKRSYTSKALAKKEVKNIRKRLGVKRYAYLCPYCDKWHLTKKKHG